MWYPVGQEWPHLRNDVPQSGSQRTWLSHEPGHEKLQDSLVTWYSAGQDQPHVRYDEQEPEQEVHSPQWQQSSQVRNWQLLKQPDDDVLPRVHSIVPVHSHPLLQLPSQLL